MKRQGGIVNPYTKAKKVQKTVPGTEGFTMSNAGSFAPNFNPGDQEPRRPARLEPLASTATVPPPVAPSVAPPVAPSIPPAQGSSRPLRLAQPTASACDPPPEAVGPQPPLPSACPPMTLRPPPTDPPPKKKDVSKVAKSLRKVLQEPFFPRIDDKGMIYTQSGRSNRSRTTLTTDSEINVLIASSFPQAPIYILPNPEIRALAVKGQGQWTKETAREAADCFYVPEKFEMILVWPDFLDREALQKYEAFKTPTKGVLTPCIYCKTNTHVKLQCFSVSKHGDPPRRSVKSDATSMALVGPVMECSNPDCSGPTPKLSEDGKLMLNKKPWNEDSAKATKHTFRVWRKDCFAQYPKCVQERYNKYLGGIGMNEDGTTFAASDLVADIIDDRNTFADIAQSLERKYLLLEAEAEDRYVKFVKAHGAPPPTRVNDIRLAFGNAQSMPTTTTSKEPLWPSFDQSTFRSEVGPPGVDAIETLFYIAFEKIKPYLLRDLFSRLPTETMSHDATFELAKKTMVDILSEEEAGALGMIYDAFGRILFYGFMDGEKPEHWQRMYYFLRKRAERAGPDKAGIVRVIYSDLCCEGLADRSSHWITKIWPNVTVAPRKDLFHALTMVNKSTRGPSHELHTGFTADLSAATLGFTEGSKKDAIDEYLREHPGVPRDSAYRTVLSTKKWKSKMYNYTLPIEHAEKECHRIYAKLEEDDEELAEVARSNNEGYARYIRKPVKGVQRGTKYEMENFLIHLRKGCYQDEFPPHQMSYPKKPATARAGHPEKLPKLGRKRGTNGGESSNKQVNHVSKKATRQLRKLTGPKVLLRASRLNADKDDAISHITGVPARPPYWYLLEATDNTATPLSHLESTSRDFSYPPETFVPEPVGYEFSDYKYWSVVDQELYCQPVTTGQGQRDLAEHESSPQSKEPDGMIDTDVSPSRLVGFACGNTVWNRKEGGHSRKLPHKQFVREPLTDWQETTLAHILLQVQHLSPPNVQALGPYIDAVRNAWDQLHYTESLKGCGGLGGIMHPDIAKS